MSNFWKGKRVIVTGGAGFLGSFVIAKLKVRGATDIFIPHIEDYDLTDIQAIRRLFDNEGIGSEAQSASAEASSQDEVVIIHLAALVGGAAKVERVENR